MQTGTKLVGQLIRDLRKQRGWTGELLGQKARLSQSKISKIEIGYYPRVHLKDIDLLLNILEAPNDIRQRIYREIEHIQPMELIHQPYHFQFDTISYKVVRESRHCQTLTLFILPALLQTAAYRLVVLKRAGIAEQDLGSFMEDTNKRQDLLWDSQRSFHFLIHQAAFYNVPQGQQHIMAPQLDRLERMIDLPSVKIGVIPFESRMFIADINNFAICDNQILFMALVSFELTSTDAEAIAVHRRIFAELDQLAVYGENAKDLIIKAQAHFR